MNNDFTFTKNIFITRHGHADFSARSDFYRELTPKGKIAVKNTAQFIHDLSSKKSLTVQKCLSSAAIRTQQTAEIICQHNNIHDCRFKKELYSTSVSTWLDMIAAEKSENLIIVGHNPTFSQMINVLCGYEIYMKPANCAFVSLEIKADGFVYPAKLNDIYQH